MVGLQGLSEQEAVARRARGQGNEVAHTGSRTYAQILRDNVVALINIALLSIGAALVALGRYSDAVITAGVVVINILVGVFQEVRAKRRLDRISLLTRPRATVMRDGREREADPSELVFGDLVIARPGDQILVDGRVVGAGRMEVDESLLTGEEESIPKRAGDLVYSGSFCVTGSAVYEAEKVGDESLASTLAAGARIFRRMLTPLQEEVNLVLRVLLLMTGFFGTLLLLASIIHDFPLTDTVLAGAVIAGLVPPGLFLMITIAYAMAAVRLAQMDALVQQANAVESLSNVDVLCLDKTGTLTANRIQLNELSPAGVEDAELRAALGDFAASVTSGNKTSEAISTACPGTKRPLRDEVPFSSARKWSAIACDEADRRGVYVLGAPEMLRPFVAAADEPNERRAEWVGSGLRVLLFAHSPRTVTLHDDQDEPILPSDLTALGWIAFSDELRMNSRETLQGFTEAGIALKIISGDNPQTVAALARQAGLPQDAHLVSGQELEGMDDGQFAQAARDATVFGRVTPRQKERLVQTLRDRGHYVAMIGDGVNDVLSLKKANLGIAMQSGSQATRNVADIILLNDSFAALPAVFMEGQRIRNGMQDVLKLFLTRVFSVALILLSVVVLQAGFPFSPRQISILSTLTVGVPAFALAAWARTGVVPRRGLVRSLLHFVLPASITLSAIALGVYLYYFVGTQETLMPSGGLIAVTTAEEAARGATVVASDAATVTTILGGLLLIVFAEPPTRFWTGGDELSGDWKPTILAVGMLACYVVIMAVPAFRQFFGLTLLDFWDYAGITAIVIAWGFALRFIWRARIFERFLGVRLP